MRAGRRLDPLLDWFFALPLARRDQALAWLSGKNRDIFEKYILDGWPSSDLAAKHEISRSRVNQIVLHSFDKMRKNLKRKKSFLD